MFTFSKSTQVSARYLSGYERSTYVEPWVRLSFPTLDPDWTFARTDRKASGTAGLNLP